MRLLVLELTFIKFPFVAKYTKKDHETTELTNMGIRPVTQSPFVAKITNNKVNRTLDHYTFSVRRIS